MGLERMKSPEVKRNLKMKVISCAAGVNTFTATKRNILQ